jgi:hypothetical protein
MASHNIQHYQEPDSLYENEADEFVNRGGAQKGEKRSKRPKYFPSNKPQVFIVNAVTGVPYPYVVGSKEQTLLYKMVDATGRCDEDGYTIKAADDLPNFNTNHLFYDSPEQCMSHLRVTINQADVKRWHDHRQMHDSRQIIE